MLPNRCTRGPSSDLVAFMRTCADIFVTCTLRSRFTVVGKIDFYVSLVYLARKMTIFEVWTDIRKIAHNFKIQNDKRVIHTLIVISCISLFLE